MRLYHGTSSEAWQEIQQEGVLWGRRNAPSRCTYLATNVEDAKVYGKIILAINYTPGSLTDNWVDGCWQVRVYDPLPIILVERIGE